MVVDVAMKHLNINTQTISHYRNGTHPINVHVEHGVKVKAPEPYKHCLFLYITAEGTPATNYSIIFYVPLGVNTLSHVFLVMCLS
jgi:hypothetical protein